ncbi:MAG: OmpA family protein [Candidatus Latescibacterota bacterium]|nr:MAG: OmpA family protein [Candidatus Latescibacterota bacterium]
MRRLLAILLATVVVAAARPADASVAYHGTRGLIRTVSADNIGKGKLSFQLGGHYFKYGDLTLTPGIGGFLPPTPTDTAVVDYHFFTTRVSLTYGLSEYLEFAANLDIRNWLRDPVQKNRHSFDSFTRGGLGDTQLSAKASAPIPVSQVKVGALGEVHLPTGDESHGLSTDKTEILAMGLVTFDFVDLDAFVPTRLHLNAGYRWNKNETEGYGIFLPDFADSSGFAPPAYPAVPEGENSSYNDIFIFNSAIEFPAPQVTFFVEFDWRQFINLDPVPSGFVKSTYTLTPGLAVNFPSGFELKTAGDINLNSGDNPSVAQPPDWGLWLMASWTGAVIPQDSDHDGVSDKDDQCPDQPEDLDGFEDDDGCPELDNDGDGISDLEDKCPDLAEDADGFEDQDGCPDLDNDQDGIADTEDRCPNEPEDFDGDADTDGCPDLVKDSDNDGIPDDVDRCPLQAEDVDGFQDDDGCPDLDNDLDGIPDANDKCPNAPETFNGFEDEDGCPDERPIEQQFILRGVNFESGSAALTPDSYRILDEVVRSLMAYPEVRIEIRGYTDNVGKASYNLGLSERRAEAVKQYLVNAGIDPARLTTRGFGEENPVSTNATPEGRAQNRRIEFKRLN